MNPSLTVPPATAAARFRSANRASNVSRWRAWLRSFMIGERVSRTGATVRPTDHTVLVASAARSSGRGIARNAAGTAERVPAVMIPNVRTSWRTTLSRIRSTVPGRSPSGRSTSGTGAAVTPSS